jgi:hypothetical protein
MKLKQVLSEAKIGFRDEDVDKFLAFASSAAIDYGVYCEITEIKEGEFVSCTFSNKEKTNIRTFCFAREMAFIVSKENYASKLNDMGNALSALNSQINPKNYVDLRETVELRYLDIKILNRVLKAFNESNRSFFVNNRTAAKKKKKPMFLVHRGKKNIYFLWQDKSFFDKNLEKFKGEIGE